ncbi:MFS transporter [Rhizorhabdus histidinilytica]|uniref:Sugar phosphate permease n=1 Tax=Rhizorhabdus histidinilytica TaxID=439228 RepID=A0A1T5EN69_9SPHN|nr:MFS transporter [Rhizorhabdus histidinilytica]QEH76838.1 MFS transporter [Sphingomonas sp. C8-2]SKB85288.1 Sugar phosphate permease [Rhizorhabdus histidinilytica]
MSGAAPIPTASPPDRPAGTDEPISASAWITLTVLLLFYLMSFVDKQMIALLVNPMGKGLDLQDSQLGLLVGAAFGIFYTLSVFGAGWLLDRYSKRTILFVAVLGWSLAAAATGLAWSFEQLFVARALVGIGEGFLPPASLALIAAVFPRGRITMATSIFFAGSNIGSVLALLVGGRAIAWLDARGGAVLPFLGHLEAWRAAFVLSALPGIPLALLAFAIHRGASQPVPRAVARIEGEDDGYLRFLRARTRLLVCHNLAYGLMSSACYAVLLWAPAYLERGFGWGADRVGMVLAIGSACGAAANIGWGMMSDRLLRGGRRDAHYRLYPGLYMLCIPVTALTFLWVGPAAFLPLYMMVSVLLLGSGGMTAALQLSAPPGLRARVMGIQTLSSGIFGLALAPTLVPSLAQYVFRDRQAIGLSIAVVVGVSLLATILLLFFARRALREAVEAREEVGR